MLVSSSILWFLCRILQGNPNKELLRSLWAVCGLGSWSSGTPQGIEYISNATIMMTTAITLSVGSINTYLELVYYVIVALLL